MAALIFFSRLSNPNQCVHVGGREQAEKIGKTLGYLTQELCADNEGGRQNMIFWKGL